MTDEEAIGLELAKAFHALSGVDVDLRKGHHVPGAPRIHTP